MAALVIAVALALALYDTADAAADVGLLYDPAALAQFGDVRAAYTAVLQEEGVPHTWISTAQIGTISKFSVLILPDGLLRRLDPKYVQPLSAYAENGGTLLVVYDVGTRDAADRYRRGALLADVVGVQYMLYDSLKTSALRASYFGFVDAAAAAYWGVPSGKLIDNKLSGYYYGVLNYPQVAVRALSQNLQVWGKDAEGQPLLSARQVGKGRALWVDMALGDIKGRGDDLPMRCVLRTLLFKLAPVAHVVNTPRGLGGIVMDWHVDSNAEHPNLDAFIAERLVRAGLRCDFDITAGPDCRAPGDGLGFDAPGKGRDFVLKLAQYGEIGSHGGWAHDWYADELIAGRMSAADEEKYIRLNSEALEQITGKKVVVYSAPVNVHPQPVTTEILEKLGFCAYYYGGDTGSPPTRTFWKGKMVSTKVWAFPVMPYKKLASLAEMEREHVPPDETERWLLGLADYVVAERTVRLIYSHPYDTQVAGQKAVMLRLFDRLEQLVGEGRITVQPEPYYAYFLDRLVKTRMSFTRGAGTCKVVLDNDVGLRDFCVAVPAKWLAAPKNVSGDYCYFTVTSDDKHLEMDL